MEIKTLFRQYLNDSMTEEDFLQFSEMIAGRKYDTGELEEVLEEMMEAPGFVMEGGNKDKKEVLSSILAEIDNKQSAETTGNSSVRFSRISTVRWMAVAAAIVGVICGSYLIMRHRHSTGAAQLSFQKKVTPDIPPGRNGALLTLADGRQIELDSAGNGTIGQQGDATITKQDGRLTYAPGGTASQALVYNTLSTPKGRQFQIRLADGTRVWLNAASSIRYPIAFEGKERNVEITGEAYFEVASDPQKPFKVNAGKMEVHVLGTHFDINGYDDENTVKTTLLEGRVKITHAGASTFLAPGQQATLQPSGNVSTTDNVNLEEVVAWKEGNFQFDNSDIHTIMRQLARWYDIDVQYDATVPTHFGGTIARNVTLTKVLEMLQRTGTVNFEIKGKTVIVRH